METASLLRSFATPTSSVCRANPSSHARIPPTDLHQGVRSPRLAACPSRDKHRRAEGGPACGVGGCTSARSDHRPRRSGQPGARLHGAAPAAAMAPVDFRARRAHGIALRQSGGGSRPGTGGRNTRIGACSGRGRGSWGSRGRLRRADALADPAEHHDSSRARWLCAARDARRRDAGLWSAPRQNAPDRYRGAGGTAATRFPTSAARAPSSHVSAA